MSPDPPPNEPRSAAEGDPSKNRLPLLACALLALSLGVGAWLSRRSNAGDLEVYYRVIPRIGADLDLYHFRERSDPSEPTAYILSLIHI